MSEETYRVSDTCIKLGGVVGLVLSALIGIWQFREVREREFYSQFWNERLKLYIQSLDSAARISTTKSSEEFDKAYREFRTYFDGSMAVVQDPSVDRAMHDFVRQIEKTKSGEINQEELGRQSYLLGRVCYQSLQNSWNKPFSQISNDSKTH